MLIRKAYKENLKKLEELIEICNKQQATIDNLRMVIDSKDSLINTMEELLEEYKKENLELKRAPLKNVNDLIKHI